MMMEKKLLGLAIMALLSCPASAGARQASSSAPVQDGTQVQPAVNEEAKRTPDDALALMAAEAKEKNEQDALIRMIDRERTFEELFDQNFPMDADNVRAVREKTEALQEASRMPPPKIGQIRSRTVSLNPGSPIQSIRLYPRYVSTIRVLDVTGTPWPVAAYMVGNETFFQVQQPEVEAHNVIMVSPQVIAGNANLTLVLATPEGQDQVAPLSLQLMVSPGNRENPDTVMDLRLDRRGPNAPPPAVDGGPTFYTDNLLCAILDGVPPKGALPVKTSDTDVEAWQIGGSLYVRTKEKIVWPAWTKSTGSGRQGGALYAYELPPVVELLFQGNRSVALSPYSDAIGRMLGGEK